MTADTRETTSLIERAQYLEALRQRYRDAGRGNGFTLFLVGEAGIGKTSLVNAFLSQIQDKSAVYFGACDSLSTPRPLGPLHDLAASMPESVRQLLRDEKDRSSIFSAILNELLSSPSPVVIVFEDLHWADEATLDFVKLLARRVHRHPFLFLVTMRDDESNARSRTTIFGELPPDSYAKMRLQRLSPDAVDELASANGFGSGKAIFALTDGNPFYVTEIIANGMQPVPERVKDSILTVFASQSDPIKSLWELLAILPSRVGRDVADRLDAIHPGALDQSLESGVLVSRNGTISFKHELFRLAIEESLSASKRRSLHRFVLALIRENKFGSVSLAQIVHHAKLAGDKAVVAETAPQAALAASSLGAHVEAAKLYALAIAYTEGNASLLAHLHERHAYECYLTNQIPDAIASQERALQFWQQQKSRLKEGDALRFLSRLWWFTGNRQNALAFARDAIAILDNGFPTRERAMAYSNLAQLYMLADDIEESVKWGELSIELATRMNEPEITCHALNNVGTAMMKFSDKRDEGERRSRKSLAIALENGFHEHAARAYTNLSFGLTLARLYSDADAVFAEGLTYCEERDLNSWSYYMQSERVRLLLETGLWLEAETMSTMLLGNPAHPAMIRISALVAMARLKLRKGYFDEARRFVSDAMGLAKPTGEVQRIVPVLTAAMELAWITGDRVGAEDVIATEATRFARKDYCYQYSTLCYWMQKCGLEIRHDVSLPSPYTLEREGRWLEAAQEWGNLGCLYEEAIALSYGNEENTKSALQIFDRLGATAAVRKLRTQLKEQGVTRIPKGRRQSTKANPLELTNRQVEVLQLLSEELQNGQIADRLFISSKTVDHHIAAIFLKLNVGSRKAAVTTARKLGILVGKAL